MKNFFDNSNRESALLHNYFENVDEYSDEQLENLRRISKFDLDIARSVALTKSLEQDDKLLKSYERAMLFFAGLCVAPFASMFGGDLSTSVGIGLGLGVAGCLGYAVYSSIRCVREIERLEGIVDEAQETVDTLNDIIIERGLGRDEAAEMQR